MDQSGRPIVVTGAAGFIGSHVVEALLARGDRVLGIDNFDPYYDAARKARNVEAGKRAGGDRYEFVEADICDRRIIDGLFQQRRPASVIHLAARAGVRPSIADPIGYAHVNVTGTAVMLEAARAAGCAAFVMASSSSVYGNCRVPPGTPFSETLDVSEPISPYAATKRACELIGHTHWHLTGMPTACLRFFTVFGPRQRPDLAIGSFLRRVAAGEAVPMFGDGSTSRDYTFIADIVAGVLAAHDRIPRYGYRVWNLGGSEPITLMDMIATVGRVVGREPIIERLPMQPGDVERTYADLTRSAEELGFRPTTPFEAGVALQWEWMRAEGLA